MRENVRIKQNYNVKIGTGYDIFNIIFLYRSQSLQNRTKACLTMPPKSKEIENKMLRIENKNRKRDHL